MNYMRTLVVDDEPSSRKGLIRLLEGFEKIKIVGEAHNVQSLSETLYQLKPDLVFLDIMLRNANSLDLIMEGDFNAKFVITTAYPQHALKGYECNVLDYLLKPISEERLKRAVDKAFMHFNVLKSATDGMFLKSDGKYFKCLWNEILFIKAMENYVIVHTRFQKLVCKSTMSSLLESLPPDLFLQVHKSYIINISCVNIVEKLNVVILDNTIPISRDRKQDVYQKLFSKNHPALLG